MSPAELRELADDIQKHGLRERVVLYDDRVLDGCNRLDALELLGREPVTNTSFERIYPRKSFDPFAYVVSKNILRRHLSAEQKRTLIANLIKAQSDKSNRQIADTAKVSPTTVGSVTSTVQVGQLPEKTIGRDGKARLARRTSPMSRKEKIAANRIEKFKTAICMIEDLCTKEIPVPPLSDADAAEVIKEIEKAQDGVRALKARIKGAVRATS